MLTITLNEKLILVFTGGLEVVFSKLSIILVGVWAHRRPSHRVWWRNCSFRWWIHRPPYQLRFQLLVENFPRHLLLLGYSFWNSSKQRFWYAVLPGQSGSATATNWTGEGEKSARSAKHLAPSPVGTQSFFWQFFKTSFLIILRYN